MPLIRVIIEFDGTAYRGWQRQATPDTIQQTLEEAIGRVADEPVTLHSSGRTDAGVHARAMVAHFACSADLPLRAWRDGVNRYLPPDIAVRSAEIAPPGFHSRFDACGKWYRYTVQNGPTRSPLSCRFAWHVRPQLDLDLMRHSAADFIGEHDFTPFRSAQCDAKTTRRQIDAFDITTDNDLIYLDVRGNGFLRHMVRLMSGTLVEIGLQRRPSGDIAALLAGKSVSRTLLTAPAHGLCLMQVDYPEEALPD